MLSFFFKKKKCANADSFLCWVRVLNIEFFQSKKNPIKHMWVCSFPKKLQLPFVVQQCSAMRWTWTDGKGTETLFCVSLCRARNDCPSKIKIIAFVILCNFSTRKNAFKHTEILNCYILVAFHM